MLHSSFITDAFDGLILRRQLGDAAVAVCGYSFVLLLLPVITFVVVAAVAAVAAGVAGVAPVAVAAAAADVDVAGVADQRRQHR